MKKVDYLGVRVVRGHHFLGGLIGDLEAINQFVQGKVKEFITILSEAAQSYPQAAFVALSKSLQFEWSHLQRLIPNITNAFIPVWNAINASFRPAIFDSTVSQQDQLLFSIPVKMGGMGTRNPVKYCLQHFSISHKAYFRCHQRKETLFTS